MRYLIFVWAAVEVLQLTLIAMLVVGYRKLERRQRGADRFEERPPRSVTDE